MSRNLSVTVASGDSLDVREFRVHQALSSLFDVTLTAVSENPDIDFEAVVGKDASFTLHGRRRQRHRARTWTGLCRRAPPDPGRAGGALDLPRSASCRRSGSPPSGATTACSSCMTELDIARSSSASGASPPRRRSRASTRRASTASSTARATTSSCRGCSRTRASRSTSSDGRQARPLRRAPGERPAARRTSPSATSPRHPAREHVTGVRVGRQRAARQVHPARPRLPQPADLQAPGRSAGAARRRGAARALPLHARRVPLRERQGRRHAPRRRPGQAPHRRGRGAEARREAPRRPSAATRSPCTFDDQRTRPRARRRDVHARSPAPRARRRQAPPGRRVPHRRRAPTRSGPTTSRRAAPPSPTTPRSRRPSPRCTASRARPWSAPPARRSTPTSSAACASSSTGTARAQMNENSSCWIHVSQPWGGAGYGGINLPRIGQEVLVDFLGGDPDRPIIIGRVYTNLQKAPYKLPANKTQSGWKSNSSPPDRRLQRDDVRGRGRQGARPHAGREGHAQAGQERRASTSAATGRRTSAATTATR